MIGQAKTSVVATLVLLAILAAGCCDKSKCPGGSMSAEEAIDAILAATTNTVYIGGMDADEWDVADHVAPTADDARTNLVARFSLLIRDNAAKMAELTEKREKTVAETLEADTAFAAAYSEMVAARKRYNDLAGSLRPLQEIDAELETLRRERGALLKQRARFQEKAISKSAMKKESK